MFCSIWRKYFFYYSLFPGSFFRGIVNRPIISLSKWFPINVLSFFTPFYLTDYFTSRFQNNRNIREKCLATSVVYCCWQIKSMAWWWSFSLVVQAILSLLVKLPGKIHMMTFISPISLSLQKKYLRNFNLVCDFASKFVMANIFCNMKMTQYHAKCH